MRKSHKLWDELFEATQVERLQPSHILSGDILMQLNRIEKILARTKSPMSIVKVDAIPLPKKTKPVEEDDDDDEEGADVAEDEADDPDSARVAGNSSDSDDEADQEPISMIGLLIPKQHINEVLHVIQNV